MLSGGQSPDCSFPPAQASASTHHAPHTPHILTPQHTPHTLRRDEKGHRFPHDGPKLWACLSFPKSTGTTTIATFIGSILWQGRASGREDSEQDAKEALVAEGVLCGGYRRHQRVVFGVRLAKGQELGRRLRHLRAPA